MADIRAIGFDYLGVVAALPSGDAFREVAQLAGIGRDQVKAVYQRYNHDFQTGVITSAELWHHVADDLHIAGQFDELWRAVTSELPRLDAEVLALVGALRRVGYPVGLLSNLATHTPWADDLYAQQVGGHFSAVGLSGETGFAKPDPQAFKWLAGRLGVTTQELAFIDDRPESMAGIESLGIKPILYKNLRQLQADLHALGVEGDWHS